MAFAVTSFRAYGIDKFEALTNQFKQTVVIKGTALAADVALDLGNASGTFWSAADDTPTGLAASKAFAEILAKADVLISLNSPEIEDTKARIASGGTLAAGQFKKVTAKGATLGYTLFTAEGVTTFTIVAELSLLPGVLPTAAVYSV